VIAPRATYRLQFNREFGFAAAARVAEYLEALGVSHVYASPYLKARPGSTHGYDIVAHDQLNPELGGGADFNAMNEAFAKSKLRQILDFVPNHMGVGGADNPLWLDVLEWGPDSPYAGWFDIDWEPANRYLTEKLLVPVLGDQYGAVLEEGRLVLKFDAAAGEFAVWAYDTHKLPVSPLHYARILGSEVASLERCGDEFSALLEWRPQVARRARDLKRELAALVRTDAQASQELDRALTRFNGARDVTRRELDSLIQAQYWRASHFRVAGDDINYRRFFNINDLAGLRMELPDVFEHAHRLVLKLLEQGVLDGLRIDHVDGLLDPRGYLERLRAATPAIQGERRPCYLVVEKILARGEPLHADWPVDGTTGYEFANLLTGLLVDARGETALTDAWHDFAGDRRAFCDIVRDCKIRIMKNEMAAELNVLARDAARVARQNPRTADFTRNLLHRAIREVVACFPVYRTYINDAGRLDDFDRRCLARAVAMARRHERDLDPSVFDFLEGLLSAELVNAPRSGFSRHAVLRFAMKLQQYSGPVMAKGLEDTAFYRYNRLIALNEVGGHPDGFGITPDEFHQANAARARDWPDCMLATSTHDTKRGEDARARLAVLAEMPEAWHAAVRNWRSALSAQSAALHDANAEYFFYQLLLGSWPASPASGELAAFRERVQAAMLKSMREARVRTSWTTPDADYENALRAFVDAAFELENFRMVFLPLQREVARLGVHNSLVQATLKLTAPGVPDIYQGSELWDLNLVDPDNRRPVDYAARAALLEELRTQWTASPAQTLRARLSAWEDGAIKLLVTWRLLELRRELPRLFARGDYRPCEIRGDAAQSIVAFIRRDGDVAVAVAIARFPLGRVRDTGWARACVLVPEAPANAAWWNVLSGASLGRGGACDAAALFEDLPVAVLVTKSG
jgi:(1->4)-alpha-D-glucan 1-alpha-D-glucosylmutase